VAAIAARSAFAYAAASFHEAKMTHNPIRPWRNIERRKSRQIMVGRVPVGGDAPISVQTMTNTLTHDVKATVEQIQRAAIAGADIVRVSTPDEESTRALREIVAESPVPIVADIHFHYRRAIEAAEAGAACLRINPGNIGDAKRVAEVVRAAKDHGCSIRIGVNAGSLEKHLLDKYGEPCPDAMVESGLDHIKLLQDNDFHEFKISCKASDVFLSAAAYQQLAAATDAPIHLGITEAGGLMSGTVKSAIGLGNLLWFGIGDTIRVSLSADPVEEVKVGYEILKSLGLRTRGVQIISCPSCARQGFDVIKTVEALEKRLEHIKTPMSLSIIGCVVNGPGEALMTDIGFTGGGAGSGMVYLAGKQSHKLGNDRMIDHIVELVEAKAAEIEAAERAAAE
jgi:(E)-4-hydroxy-3-methylbut-2-enyl-diphosphate synthase